MAISPLKSGSNWNLEMLLFEERGKPEYPEKNLSSRGENQQQTQSTYSVESENQSRAVPSRVASRSYPFLFCRELFGFAVSYLVLPRAFLVCHELFGFAVNFFGFDASFSVLQ